MSNIMQRLKEETAQAHRETEQYSRGEEIMSRRLSVAGYAEVLLKNYQMHAHFEPALQSMQGLEELFPNGLNERWRTQALHKDLNMLGVAARAFDHPLATPTTVGEALGCMYVLEGSTLGGAVILKQLQQIPAIHQKAAFHFYGFYGKDLGKKWQEFGGILTNFAETHQVADEIVDFAKVTFEATKRIFSQPLEGVES